MSYSSTVFSQMLRMIPQKDFAQAVATSGANRYTKHFTAWIQFLVNLYAQVANKKSLRDVEAGLHVQQRSWHHLGIRNISRSQLAYVNSRRDNKLFQVLFLRLLDRFLQQMPRQKFRFPLPLKIIDSTLIYLCASLFPWAHYRRTKGAFKIHALLDQCTTIPEFIIMSHGKVHELKVARRLTQPVLPDSIIVMDKGYMDFDLFHDLHSRRITFITRAKECLHYEVLGQQPNGRDRRLIADRTVRLKVWTSRQRYPGNLRLITWHDDERDHVYTFMTNNFDLPAVTIAEAYKARWEIETFFKWIKQNLKIKTFLGTSPNAVMTQIWTAMIYYLLLAYIKFQTRYAYTLLHFTRVIREALFMRTDIIELLKLSPIHCKWPREPDGQRLLFSVQEFY